MKSFLFAFVGSVLLSVSGYAQTATTIEIGDHAPFPTYAMMNIDGETVSIENIKGDNGVIVIFTCNTCPFVVGRGETEGWEGRYNAIIEFADANGIGTLLVNSNQAKRDGDDSYTKMKNRARDMEYIAPYVLDEESKLANGFGARTTPHVFLFNSVLKLVYKGSIDDSVNSAEEVEEHFLRIAIERTAEGKRVKNSETSPVGCSIKRVKK